MNNHIYNLNFNLAARTEHIEHCFSNLNLDLCLHSQERMNSNEGVFNSKL